MSNIMTHARECMLENIERQRRSRRFMEAMVLVPRVKRALRRATSERVYVPLPDCYETAAEFAAMRQMLHKKLGIPLAAMSHYRGHEEEVANDLVISLDKRFGV